MCHYIIFLHLAQDENCCICKQLGLAEVTLFIRSYPHWSLTLQPRAMPKFLKSNKVAIITRGRQAGKKVVIVKAFDEGTKAHPYGHALVIGIERYPQQVYRKHSDKQITKRTRVKPFIKRVNYAHLMPTRYTFEQEGLKNLISAETFNDASARVDAKKEIKKIFEEQHKAGQNKWFFTKLAF